MAGTLIERSRGKNVLKFGMGYPSAMKSVDAAYLIRSLERRANKCDQRASGLRILAKVQVSRREAAMMRLQALNSAACSVACLRSSDISPMLPGTVFSCLR